MKENWKVNWPAAALENGKDNNNFWGTEVASKFDVIPNQTDGGLVDLKFHFFFICWYNRYDDI